MHSNPKRTPQSTPKQFSDTLSPDAKMEDAAATTTDCSQPKLFQEQAASSNGSKLENCAVSKMSSKELVQLTSNSADELMDAVFEDVDYMLDKGVSVAPNRTHGPTVALADNVAVNNIDAEGLASDATTQLASDRPDIHLDDPGADPTQDSAHNAYRWQESIKLIFPILGVCASLGAVLATGMFLYGPRSTLQRSDAGTVAANASFSNPNGEFADYMKRALETIATTQENTPNGGGSDNNVGSTSLPDNADNQPRYSGIPERVYIPVYQPSPPSLSALPSVPLNSSPPSPLSTTTEPTPVNSAPEAIATIPVSPTPAPPETNSSSDLTPPSSGLSYDHVLVGLLQLGDRSVAMFDYAEGTHRVKIGEQIGDSGWSLVSVSENEAVIRRNGDVRSIYIGQSF